VKSLGYGVLRLFVAVVEISVMEESGEVSNDQLSLSYAGISKLVSQASHRCAAHPTASEACEGIGVSERLTWSYLNDRSRSIQCR